MLNNSFEIKVLGEFVMAFKFKVGDKVVYPHYGAGSLEDVSVENNGSRYENGKYSFSHV